MNPFLVGPLYEGYLSVAGALVRDDEEDEGDMPETEETESEDELLATPAPTRTPVMPPTSP